MSADSPAAILFNSDGYELATKDGYAVTADASGIFVAGSDGSNARIIKTDSSGRVIVAGAGTANMPTGGVVSVQGVADGYSLDVNAILTDGYGNILSSTTIDGHQALDVSIVSNLDAFGRLRVSYPTNIFECGFQIDTQPLLFSETLVTGGTSTWNTTTRSVDLVTTTSNGSSVVRQSKRYFRYNAGKSHLALFSFNFGGTKANCRRRTGLFDASNGFFLELNGSILSVNIRNNGADNSVIQSAWNIDKLDGTGVSKINIDTSKVQILIIDYQWLGSGRVRFGFDIGGIIHYCHKFVHANIVTSPYSQSGTLPCRSEIFNTAATASTTTFSTICYSVQSEAGFEPTGILRSFDRFITPATVNSSATLTTPVISIRKSASYLPIPVQLIGATVFTTTADDILIRIILNPTLTGATSALSSGVVQCDIAATASAGGTVIYSNYLRASAGAVSVVTSEIFKDLNTWIGSDLAGASDIISIQCNSISTSASCFATVTFREFT